MNRRLQQFLSAENLTQAQFADAIGVARASISHILAGRNKPGFDFIERMALTYPDLNLDWLICGKGKMYKRGGNDIFGQLSPAAPADENAHAGAPEAVFDIPDAIPAADKEVSDDLPEFEEDYYEERQLEGDSSVIEPHLEASAEDAPESNGQLHIIADNHTGKERVIKKIVAFYSDNTFKELY